MKRYIGFITVAAVAIFLSACIGSGGSSAPAPNNVHVVAKDSRVIVTWDMAPGVQYWIFHANGTGVTPQNCSTMPLCYTAVNVSSPASIPSLYNGYPYSFSINGRRDGGPGGTGSAAKGEIPRPAGGLGNWTAPTPGTNTLPNTTILNGVAYGAYDANGARFVAAGAAGALYSGTVYTGVDTTTGLATTGITWAALVNPLTTPAATDFNAVNYDTYRGKYLSVGTGGKMIAMTPSTSTVWTELTGYTGGQNLLAIVNNSAGFTVVTGVGGTIIHSADGGTTWAATTSITPATTANLNAVAYGYVTALGVNRFVAVGASGTLLWSADGDSWTNVTSTSPLSTALKGVTYGLVGSVGTFVAVSADGKVITSTDGIIWTLRTPAAITASALNAVTASANAVVPLLTSATNAFVAVDNAGNIFRSVDGGVTWSADTNPATPVHTGAASDSLHAVIRGGLYDYSAVGAAGLNLYAD